MQIYRFLFSGQPAEYLVVAKTLRKAQKKIVKAGEGREPASIQRLAGSKVLP